MTFGLVYAWARASRISWTTLVYLSLGVQALLILVPIVILYVTPIAPLPSAVWLMVVCVIFLKQHSYVATNYRIHEENQKRYGSLKAASPSAHAHGRALQGGAGGSASRKGLAIGGGADGPSPGSDSGNGAALLGPSPSPFTGTGEDDKDKDSDGGGDDAEGEDDEEGEYDLDDQDATQALLRRRHGGNPLHPAHEAASIAAHRAGLSPSYRVGSLASPSMRVAFAPYTDGQHAGPGAMTLGPSASATAGSPTSPVNGSGSRPPVTVDTTSASATGFHPSSSSSTPSASAMASPQAGDGGAVVESSTSGGGYISGSPAQKRRLIKAFPHNITIKDYAYFLAAPSLVYEPRFPRTRRVRWWYVGRKLLEASLCGLFQYVIMKQFMLPVLKNPTPPVSPGGPLGEGLATAFDLMKLGIPSLMIWLTGFYALFHCWFNVLAEVLRFADRYFYAAWWNATSLDAFWRRWNVPVHEWCLRHIFLDLQNYTGVSKNAAVLATFFFSAVFHELIFSVSFKTFRPWFFLGMLMQIPLMALGKNFTNKRRGNLLVWWSLFSGQPLLELLYFREYFKHHDSFFCNAA